MEGYCSLKAILFCLCFLIVTVSCTENYRQHPVLVTCTCPISNNNHDPIPQTIANLSGDIALAICGHAGQDSDLGAITYSGFNLSDCRSHKIIYSWPADQHFTIEMDNDTLVVKNMLQLAMSPRMDWVVEPWLTERFYSKAGHIYRAVYLDTEIHYSNSQIMQVYKRMDSTTWKQQSDLDSNKMMRMMRFASQLMIASISGDTNAKGIFYRFKEKLQPQNEYAIWYAQFEKVMQFSEQKDSLLTRKIY